jgi:predicted DNA-binding helix-hairpin-helix protein
MDSRQKLQLLGNHMALEPAEEAETVVRPTGLVTPSQVAACGYAPAELQQAFGEAQPLTLQAPLTATMPASPDVGATPARIPGDLGIHHAVMPGGKRLALLKTLLTSACERDCYYCPFRARRNFRRVTFKPEEMAKTFHDLQQAGLAQGLFLSSGIAGGGVRTQDRLLDTAALLRRRYAYEGYLHLKLMPGVEREQVLQAMRLADRVSINLEAPNTARLQQLAPHKVFLDELLQPLKWAEEIRQTLLPRQTLHGRWPSLVTQFVVGGAGESDREILTTTAYLTRRLRLQRVYFSAFRPVPDTPMEQQAPENPWREHRLYQAAILLRDYGFNLGDMPFAMQDNLPLEVDPKLGWAQLHLRDTPVEINRADRHELLRIPGIGPKGAEAILRLRRHGRVRDIHALQRLGVLTSRAAPFILLDGKAPVQQLQLF